MDLLTLIHEILPEIFWLGASFFISVLKKGIMYPVEIQNFDSWKVTGWNDLGKKKSCQPYSEYFRQPYSEYLSIFFFNHKPLTILLQSYILLITRRFPGVMKARCL